MDVWTAIEASGFEKTYTTVTGALLDDEGVDAVLVIMGANHWLPGREVPGLFAGFRKDHPRKPVIAVAPLGDREIYLKMLRGFQAIGIPCYSADEDAVFALAALWRYRQRASSGA
ncbi:MAG: hypothetical protein A2137_01285 [Chloroflexi bacterium RBG_16_58_8]|nr:MAG: hypothetical protein A2137_01285 [Chloroflexi bacterium RBG_16_58_8]